MIYFFGNEKLSKLLHEEEPRVLFIFESMEYFFSHFILNFLPIGVKTEITRQKHHVTPRFYSTLKTRYLFSHIYICVSWPSFHCARVPEEAKGACTGSGKASANVSNIPCEQTLARLPVQRVVDSIRTKRVPGTWLPGRNNDPCIRGYRPEGG